MPSLYASALAYPLIGRIDKFLELFVVHDALGQIAARARDS